MLLTIAGLGVLAAYETRPVLDVDACATWPEDTTLAIECEDAAWTLLVFAHPRCPCTRATFEELERALVHRPDDLAVYVVFYRPEGESDRWIETGLARRARTWGDVSIVSDPDGVEARRFGAPASGKVFLFDSLGRTCFAGGVTPSRGHSGDNAGKRALLDWWEGEQKATSTFPLYGCLISEAEACCERR